MTMPDDGCDATRGVTRDATRDAARSKDALRHAAFAGRRGADAAGRRAAGERLVREARLAGLLDPGRTRPDAGTVAAYVSMGTEIDMRPLLAALLEAGRRVLVPRLGSGLDVGWSELDALDALRPVKAARSAGAPGSAGASGSRRPEEPEASPTLDGRALARASAVFVPALAVDAYGTRLGRGGGWYDRALAHRAAGTLTVAVCWPWEVRGADEPPLPRETHDRPVDAVLTPDGFRMLRPLPSAA